MLKHFWFNLEVQLQNVLSYFLKVTNIIKRYLGMDVLVDHEKKQKKKK